MVGWFIDEFPLAIEGESAAADPATAIPAAPTTDRRDMDDVLLLAMMLLLRCQSP